MSGDSAALTAPTKTRIGDTRFGQWLQKFSAEGGRSKRGGNGQVKDNTVKNIIKVKKSVKDILAEEQKQPHIFSAQHRADWYNECW